MALAFLAVFSVFAALIVVVVLSLLAWMPAPATGGAKIFAWILLLYGVVFHLTRLLLDGHIPEQVKGSPYHSLMSWAPRL